MHIINDIVIHYSHSQDDVVAVVSSDERDEESYSTTVYSKIMNPSKLSAIECIT